MLWTFWASIFSFSLAYPVCYWYRSKYFIPKKYIDGRKLRFDGSLLKMYIIYSIGLSIVVGLLFLIRFLVTTYINSLNISPKTISNIINGVLALTISFFIVFQEKRIVQQGTHFEDEVDKKSGFDTRIFLLFFKTILVKIISAVSAGFLYPISESLKYFYDYNRCYIDGYHFTYKFSIRKLYPRWFLDLFLSIVTFGFYLPAATLRIEERNQTFVHIKK